MPDLYWTVFANVEKSALAAWLSPSEQSRLESFPSERRKRNWLAGRLAAKTIISRYLHQKENRSLPPAKTEIVYASNGEPRVRIDGKVLSHLSLSIAHSHGHGFAGLSELNEEGRIGVDIECIHPVNERLASRFLSSEELQAIRASYRGREHEGLILYWTLKEAALKALKPVLATVSMRQLEVQMGKSQGQAQIHLPLNSKEISLEARYQQERGVFSAYALASADLKTIIATR